MATAVMNASVDICSKGSSGTAIASAGDRVGVAPSCEELFEGLHDFRNLTRERSLKSLREGLDAGRFLPDEVESLVQTALASEVWEAKQGGLLASAEAVRAWDRPNFRSALLKQVPRLLADKEYRVRKAVAVVLEECCQRDFLQIYDALSDVVLGDIRDKFSRVVDAGEADPAAPPTFLPDTEGWRSLETSMGALEAMMKGCGSAFTPRISAEMLDLLYECSKHTNRFVREYAYFALGNVFDVCDAPAFVEWVAPQTVRIVAAGIRDNWSQVRYAASVAARSFMMKAADEQHRFYPELLGLMCLNRHYVAEGVRLYSQQTWRTVCGPQGGARLLVANFDPVIAAYAEAAQAPNHAVREAGCHCISELAERIAGRPSNPTPHREHFTETRIERLLQTLLGAFEDESWPVRDVASMALGHFILAFPDHCMVHRPKLLELWFEQMADNIPSLRRNGAKALTMAMSVWRESLWDTVLQRLKKTLPEVLLQPENSEVFSDYTPSGPFSVPRKAVQLDDKPDPAVTDQTMYSCGSIAPKTFKRRVRDSGCMNCSTDHPHQLWEASEGMVHLHVDLAVLTAQQPTGTAVDDALDALAALLPLLAKAYGCSQYRHHHLLKQKACERMTQLTEALTPRRLLPHFPELLRITHTCFGQDAHRALQESAREVIVSWRRNFTTEEWETACRTAEIKPEVLPCT